VGHVCGAFCVALVKNEYGRWLLEDSSTRDTNDPHDIRKKREKLHAKRGKWCPNTWMGRDVFLYGGAAIPEDHQVVEFLQRDESTLPRRIRVLGTSYQVYTPPPPTAHRRPLTPHIPPTPARHASPLPPNQPPSPPVNIPPASLQQAFSEHYSSLPQTLNPNP
jgi:hypothetical protein